MFVWAEEVTVTAVGEIVVTKIFALFYQFKMV
jgi:hypothetical protein